MGSGRALAFPVLSSSHLHGVGPSLKEFRPLMATDSLEEQQQLLNSPPGLHPEADAAERGDRGVAWPPINCSV